jgi:hypothetical protein
MLVNIKIILNAGIQLASYKIHYIAMLMFSLFSCGSIYICVVVLLVWLPDRNN